MCWTSSDGPGFSAWLLPSKPLPGNHKKSMKNFHQNLLIVLAMSLCALCAYQWYGQTVQRNQIEGLNQLLYEKSGAIQSYTNSIKTMDRQIAQLDARISELKQTAETNDQFILAQKKDLSSLRANNSALTNQIGEYKKGVDTLETRLKEAYDGIKRQNESMKELVAQRDDFVKKLNDSVKERNDIVTKYNELVDRIDKLQGGGTKASQK
jgi:chromosome segregation ATPase